MYQIHRYSHHFTVAGATPRLQMVIDEYCRLHLTEKSFSKNVSGKSSLTDVREYFVKTYDPLIYRFHSRVWKQFTNFLIHKGISGSDFEIIDVPLPAAADAEFKIVSEKRPWKQQPKIIEYLCSSGKRKIVELQAGQGKTLCALFAATAMGKRTLLNISPSYIERWLDDTAKSTGIWHLKKGEVCVVRGGSALRTLFQAAQDGDLSYKFIILSNDTLSSYIRHYLAGEDMDAFAGVMPWEISTLLNLGLWITDEAHMKFHACFITELFIHVAKTISLSATLKPDQQFMQKMYEIMYPSELRIGGEHYVVYVNCDAIPYVLDKNNKSKISTTPRGRTTYNQMAYEASIAKDKQRLANWLAMVHDLVDTYWYKVRVPGYRTLVFAGLVEMCQTIVDYLSAKYPDVKVGKYTAEDPPSVLEELDIIVSTPGSAGTAVDISKLQSCICMVALNASQANLQMIGRLRELRGVDVNPVMVYAYCVDIPKHVEYHENKVNNVFKNRVLTHRVIHPPVHVV